METISNSIKEYSMLLIVILFVSIQFIDATIIYVNYLPVTVQKLAILLLLLIIPFVGNIRIPFKLIGLIILYIMSCSFAYWFSVNTEAIIMIILTAIGYLCALVVLFTVLSSGFRYIDFFAKTWVVFAFITSLVTVLQSIGFLPLFFVSEEMINARIAFADIYRGVGFKYDPNFQALMLVLGLALLRITDLKKHLIFLIRLIIFFGIIATMSRMGVVIALIIFLLEPLFFHPRNLRGSLGMLRNLAILSIFILILYNIMPMGLKEYYAHRSIDIVASVFSQPDVQDHITSAESRLVLAKTSIKLIPDNILTGIGCYDTNYVIEEATGIKNVAHNTYLEFALSGGIWGILFLSYYLFILFNVCIMKEQVNQRKIGLILFIVAFLISGLFLSLPMNFVLWIPIILALSYKEVAKNQIFQLSQVDKS